MTKILDLPFSAACERNKDVILRVAAAIFSEANSVLEIGSGTGQHAVHFAQAFPELLWQTSDQSHYLSGIHAQLGHAKLNNLADPLVLDVNQSPWLMNSQIFDVVYSANTLHIMSDSDVVAFFQGLPSVSKIGSYLIIYGPFKYQGKFTSQSNAAFDQSLRSRGCGSSIKAFKDVDALAKNRGFELLHDHLMPANNQCLIWRKKS